MKRAVNTLIVLVVLSVGIYFVIGLFNNKSHLKPTITVDEKKLEVARGSYCWKGLIKSICAGFYFSANANWNSLKLNL